MKAAKAHKREQALATAPKPTPSPTLTLLSSLALHLALTVARTSRYRSLTHSLTPVRIAGSTCPILNLTSGPLLEQVLAASTAQRLEVEEKLRASAEELLQVSTELHGAREH